MLPYPVVSGYMPFVGNRANVILLTGWSNSQACVKTKYNFDSLVSGGVMYRKGAKRIHDKGDVYRK